MAELAQAVRAAPVANADETSWLQAHKLCWLWVVVTGWITVFTIAQSRRGEVIKGMLGEDFAGIVILSVAATCQQQQRSFLDYLTAACSAQQHGLPGPSLLPSPP